MIKISAKGIAKFMMSLDATRRRILFDFKHPDPEGRAQAIYYRDAINAIRIFHQLDHPRDWLIRRALTLTSEALSRESASALRLRQNARAIQQYETKWGEDHVEIRERLFLSLRFGDVRISAHPDLHVIVKDSVKIIKFEFSAGASNQKVFEIMSQCMFEAARLAGLPVSSKDVLVYDVPRGQVYKGARFGSRTAKDIEAACEAISAVWERI